MTAWSDAIDAAQTERVRRSRRGGRLGDRWRWLIVAAASIACGKKGAPLPPLIRVPAPPADFTAERRGEEVKLQFTVPSANTDGTRPANVERLDILRFTGPSAATDADLVKLGTKVASVPVKAPANPDITTEADEPPEEPELKDEGLDQGAVAQLEDTLVPAALKAVELPKKGRRGGARRPGQGGAGAAARAASSAARSTLYVIVGINTKGRKGPMSRRVRVPLVPPPKPPSADDDHLRRDHHHGGMDAVAVDRRRSRRRPPATCCPAGRSVSRRRPSATTSTTCRRQRSPTRHEWQPLSAGGPGASDANAD